MGRLATGIHTSRILFGTTVRLLVEESMHLNPWEFDSQQEQLWEQCPRTGRWLSGLDGPSQLGWPTGRI